MCETVKCVIGANKKPNERTSEGSTVRESVDCVCVKSDETVGCVAKGRAAVAPSVSTRIGEEDLGIKNELRAHGSAEADSGCISGTCIDVDHDGVSASGGQIL